MVLIDFRIKSHFITLPSLSPLHTTKGIDQSTKAHGGIVQR